MDATAAVTLYERIFPFHAIMLSFMLGHHARAVHLLNNAFGRVFLK